MDLFLPLLLLASLGTFAAFLSALETAVSSLRPHHLEHLSQSGEAAHVTRSARLLQESPAPLLLALLLVSGIVNFLLAVLTLSLVFEFAPQLGFRRWPVAIAFLFGVVFLIDIVPKAVALSHPKDTLRRSSRLLLAIHPLVTPVARALESASSWVIDRLVPPHLQQRALVTEDEIRTWIEMRRDLGTLGEGESDIIQEIVRLGEKTAKDCMTPRVDAFAIPDDLTTAEARERVRSQSHWKIPVYKEVRDSIVGVLDAKSLLLAPEDSHYLDHISPPIFVPETMGAVDLFRDCLAEPYSLVIILDEYGGFEGLVTHADVIEAMVGDAAPASDSDPEIQSLGRGRLLVTGAARLDEIGDELGVDIEKDGLDTIGGLVFNTLTYLPDPGVKVVLGEVVATVRKCSRNRIEELVLEKTSLRPVEDGNRGNPHGEEGRAERKQGA